MISTLVRLMVVAAALAAGGVAALQAATSTLRMPEVFTDHMVLQQEQPLAVWGWSAPGERIKVTIDASTLETRGGADGKWTLTFPPLSVAKTRGQAITFKVVGATDSIEYQDVLMGEVWLASGQSNMNQPVSREDIKAADHPQIRLLTTNGLIPRRDRLTDVVGWVVCTPENIARCGHIIKDAERRPFSEVAYAFARKLQGDLKVPIGIIHTSCGGSTAKDWTPNPDIATQYPFDMEHGDIRHKFGILYQARLQAVVPYTIKGVVWYQGEDDAGNPKYAEEFTTLIGSWRQLWKQPALPFHFVQIAQTTYRGGMLGVWAAQASAMNTMMGVGLVPTNDIYDNGPGRFKPDKVDERTGWPIAGGSNPHPPNRSLVGGRLADVALSLQYGKKNGEVFGPMYNGHRIMGDRVIITFKHAGGALSTNDGAEPNWFEVSADGKTYVKAEARITGVDTVQVGATDVPKPKSVRFAWHPLCRHNLINKSGLPAIPFQSAD